MIGRGTGLFFSRARDALARLLLRLGVGPDALTIFGTALTVAAGACLAWGAKTSETQWLLAAGVGLYFCFACDMLDGAVARLGGKATPFGAFLDSTLDRVADFAIFGGLAVGYAWRSPANLAFMLLSLLCLLWAFLISYVKCRAEDFIENCGVGYWRRGERCAGVLIACFACNPAGMLLLYALSLPFTVWRRLRYTHQAMTGQTPPADPRRDESWWRKIQPWRYPRTSLPYDVITLANIAVILFFRFDADRWDLLKRWFGE
jgi:phosphatidylglycerophosphate synthase